MLLGFDDEYESDDEFALPLLEECDVQWQPAASRQTVVDSFRAQLHNLVGLHDLGTSANISADATAVENNSVASQLLRSVVFANCPELYCPRPRKRLRGKQVMPLGESLYRIQVDPEGDYGLPFTYYDRQLGYHEMVRAMSRNSGKSIRAILPMCRTIGKTLPYTCATNCV